MLYLDSKQSSTQNLKRKGFSKKREKRIKVLKKSVAFTRELKFIRNIGFLLPKGKKGKWFPTHTHTHSNQPGCGLTSKTTDTRATLKWSICTCITSTEQFFLCAWDAWTESQRFYCCCCCVHGRQLIKLPRTY